MQYQKISDFVFDCSVCKTRCDGISKGIYVFGNDTVFSEKYENLIIEYINKSSNFIAQKCDLDGYPDLQLTDKNGKLHSYLEVKVQQRTFMKVEKYLPFSDLKPSETLSLNLSDLLRYFEIFDKNKISTSIVWVLQNRPCIVNENEIKFYFQNLEILKNIYQKYKDKRRFRRNSGDGDVVDGVHKGVTLNYHFSLKELKEWKIIKP
jgi:hypothetical protein